VNGSAAMSLKRIGKATVDATMKLLHEAPWAEIDPHTMSTGNVQFRVTLLSSGQPNLLPESRLVHTRLAWIDEGLIASPRPLESIHHVDKREHMIRRTRTSDSWYQRMTASTDQHGDDKTKIHSCFFLKK
jgi:hypothetical protein